MTHEAADEGNYPIVKFMDRSLHRIGKKSDESFAWFRPIDELFIKVFSYYRRCHRERERERESLWRQLDMFLIVLIIVNQKEHQANDNCSFYQCFLTY